jgi:hypothetical protein
MLWKRRKGRHAGLPLQIIAFTGGLRCWLYHDQFGVERTGGFNGLEDGD